MTGTPRCQRLACCAHTEAEHEMRPEQRRMHGNICVVTAPLNICYRCYDEYFEEKVSIRWWDLIRGWRFYLRRPALPYRHRLAPLPDPTPATARKVE